MRKYYASKHPSPEARELANTALSRKIAARGMVLLENDGTLPLKAGASAALYGYGARHTAYCGYGAASTSSREYVSIEEGLKQAGIRVTTEKYLSQMEEEILAEEENYFSDIRKTSESVLARLIYMYGHPFSPQCQPLIGDADDESASRELAIFVLTRISGEGADRKAEAGDYELNEAEKNNLRYLSEHYRKLVVILNTCGVVDTSFIRNLPNLAGLLFAGINGGTTGGSVADVLTGKVVPEGKLGSTWAQDYRDYPNAEAFLAADPDDVYYTEGIYVGYRYFDSFGIQPAYEFGFGRSYTAFSWELRSAAICRDGFELQVCARNTGNKFAGRETLQLYVSAPAGELPQPAQKLVAFQKTALLAPGEEEQLLISAKFSTLSSWRERDASWVLEAGDYVFRLGNSSRNTKPAFIIRLKEDAVIRKTRQVFSADSVGIEKEFTPDTCSSIFTGEVLPEDLPVLYFNDLPQTETVVYNDSMGQPPLEHENSAPGENPTFTDVLSGKTDLDSFVNSLSSSELALLLVGNVPGLQAGAGAGGTIVAETRDDGADIDSSVPLVIAPGCSENTRSLMESREIPNMNVCDGGTGLRLVQTFWTDQSGKLIPRGLSSVKNVNRLFDNPAKKAEYADEVQYYQYTTPLPMATILASTWDEEAFFACGEIEGWEMSRYGVRLWLGPSMNLHRNPLCGRNFEYYSEDPLLTGKAASGVIRGIQKYPGCGACIKHVACNNQEENRGAVNVHVSERVLREIYLRGFEIAVREAMPLSMMTALNLINGVHAANSSEILNEIIRNEWGFSGFVMTDWGTTGGEKGNHRYGPSDAAVCILAGNDLIMPGTKDDVDKLLQALSEDKITIPMMRKAALNLLRVMQKLYQDTKW